MSVIDDALARGNEDDLSGDRKNKKHTHEVFARAEKCSNASFYYYIYPWSPMLSTPREPPLVGARRAGRREELILPSGRVPLAAVV